MVGAEGLERRASGEVVRPGDEGFEAEIAGFNTAYRHSVGMAVAATCAEDVVWAVRYSRERGLKLAVQATGHGVHSRIVTDVLVSTRRLNWVNIHAETRSVTVGSGVIWRAVFQAGEPYGLVPMAGSSPTVGVVGYLLGGGLGPLARSHGFGSDYLEELTVVTGTGEMVKAGLTENADLFWALRGGKCGLGVVLEARLRLVSLPELIAGCLHFEDGNDLKTVLQGWLGWTRTAPEQATTSLAFGRRGETMSLGLRVACPSFGLEAALAPLRQLAPCKDEVSRTSPSILPVLHGDPDEPFAFWVSGLLLGELDRAFAMALLAQLEEHPTLVGFELRHLGGATERDVPEGSAVGGRAAKFAAAFMWRPQLDLFETAHPRSEARLREALAPWLHEGTNINFAARVRDRAHFDSAWPPEIREGLEKVRNRYDPDGIFRSFCGQV